MVWDVKFNQYELPIVEFELDNNFLQDNVEKIKENCFMVMQEININNIMVKFLTKEAIDRYIGYYAHPYEGINVVAKLNAEHMEYVVTNYLQEIKAYSDVIFETTEDELKDLQVPQIEEFYPALQIGFKCDGTFVGRIDTLLEDLKNLGTTKFILMDPDLNAEFDFNGFNTLLERIYSMNSELRLFLERGNLPVHVLRQHPCNGYILSCESCHSGKKDLPRVFTIKSDGRVFPEGMGEEFPEFVMGSIFEKQIDELLGTYRFSENHMRFKEACKRVYHEYVLNYPFGILPWRYFYIKKAKEILAEGTGQ